MESPTLDKSPLFSSWLLFRSYFLVLFAFCLVLPLGFIVDEVTIDWEVLCEFASLALLPPIKELVFVTTLTLLLNGLSFYLSFSFSSLINGD